MHVFFICLGVSGAILKAAGQSVVDECKKHGNLNMNILYIYNIFPPNVDVLEAKPMGKYKDFSDFDQNWTKL